ncbi:hypothetical protein QOT17_016792 [Balamuthia mandrillaris]
MEMERRDGAFEKKGEEADEQEPLMGAGPQATTPLSARDVVGLISVIQQMETHMLQVKQRLQAAAPPPPSSQKQKKRGRRIKKWMHKYVLLFSVLWQLLNLAVLYLTERSSKQQQTNKSTVDISAGVMIIFQTVHLLLIVIMSIKLTKQVLHNTAPTIFLASSYLSTILLFAGIYSLIYRVDEAAFSNVHAEEYDEVEAIIVFVRLLYFSTATMTTVGFGDIHPQLWYSSLAVLGQMLLSVVYTSVIFAKGTSYFMVTQSPPRQRLPSAINS